MLTRRWSSNEARENQAACRSRPASPCFLHVRRDRSGSRRNPRYTRAAGRVVGRDRVAPFVSRHHGQRAGAGVRARHSVLAAFATTPAQAVAPEASRRALNQRSGPGDWKRGLTLGRWGYRQRISADWESITAVTTIDAAR